MANNISGIDLRTDDAIQKICETSNKTSGTTRSILYIIVLSSILSLIAVWQTRPHNWVEGRIKSEIDSVRRYRQLVVPDDQSLSDTIANRIWLQIHERKLDYILRNRIENYQTVKIPILGNAFDVDDLGIISGFTFVVLLFIARYTLKREVNNLVIALISITERYPAHADTKIFSGQSDDGDKVDLAEINKTRRKHHYNYLSMNEVFTFPPLSFMGNITSNIGTTISTNMFWLPCIVSLSILVNDAMTWSKAWSLNPTNTMVSIIGCIVFILLTGYLANKCTLNKKQLSFLYITFFTEEYTYKGDIVDNYIGNGVDPYSEL